MSINKYLEELSKPFDTSDVKWRLQGTNKEKTGGWAVAYLDSRAIAKRLDDVVGQMRWKDEYKPWINSKGGASQLCIISIYDDELKEWISKCDGAELSAISPIKGGISDAFKRAAVKWGIGRYLYAMQPVWVKTVPKNSSAVIDSSENTKLQQEYTAFLSKLSSDGSVQKSSIQPVPTKTAEKPDYEILGVKTQKSEQGIRSMLQIKHQNKVMTAYYNGADNNFKAGARLGRAVFISRETGYGKINILQDYDMAA